MKPEIQDALLEPLIFHYERGNITEGHFLHIARAIIACAPREQGELIESVVRLIGNTMTPPHERPPGAPGSKPRKESQ